MAYIGKFRDGWRAQVQKDGVRKTKTFALKKDAQTWATMMESKKTLSTAHTLRKACDRYLETVSVTKGREKAVNDKKTAVVAWEGRRFDALCAYFGEDKPLAEIDSDAMARWRDSRLKTVTGATVLRETNLYRNMFKTAKNEWKWIDHEPYGGVKLPKDSPPRATVWRWRQILLVLREGKKRGGKTYEVTQAFHIALRTAMRLKEAVAAPECFNAGTKTVTIPPSKTNPLPETIPLTRLGHRLMLKMQPFKVKANEASTIFSDLCNQLLIEGLQFRDSRATAITLMARRMDILTLARITRHRDMQMLRDVYYRETAEEIAGRLK